MCLTTTDQKSLEQESSYDQTEWKALIVTAGMMDMLTSVWGQYLFLQEQGCHSLQQANLCGISHCIVQMVLMMMVPMIMTTLIKKLLLAGVMVKEVPGPSCSKGEYRAIHCINHHPGDKCYQNLCYPEWLVIHPMDIALHPLNNGGQVLGKRWIHVLHV